MGRYQQEDSIKIVEYLSKECRAYKHLRSSKLMKYLGDNHYKACLQPCKLP